MNDEEKFRKKLLDMLDENQYAYDADNWEKASQVLDQEDAGRRKRFLYILLFIGLGLVVGGYLLFVPGETSTEKIAVRTEKHTNTAEHNSARKPLENLDADPAFTHASEKAPSAKPAQTPVEPVTVEAAQPLPERTPQAPSPKTAKAPVKMPAENVTKAPLPLINPVKQEPNEKADDRTATKTRGKADLTLKPVIRSAPGKENTDTQVPVVSKGKGSKKDGTDMTLPVPGNEEAPETPVAAGKEDAAKQAEETPVTKSATEKKKTEEAPVSDNVSSKSQAENTPVSEPASEKKKPEETPVNDLASAKQPAEETPVASIPAETKKDSVQPPLANKDSVITKKPDSTVVAAIQPTPQAQPAMNYCFAEAGGFFNLGWNHAGTREGASINPYLGLSYMMELGDKTKVSAGLYYTTVSGLALGSKTITSSRIVFGEEKDIIVITPQRMNFVSVPLKFYYALSPKQSLSFGCSVNYLLDVQSKVTTHTEQLNTVRDEKTYRTGGYVEGFRTFNTQIGVGYRRTLYKNLSVNADLLFGLGDLRDDVFSGIPLKERMSGLRLSLTYDLIKK